ncbi:MAG: polysaccharide deacetylase family protein [Gemmatimonadaceae bacterium]|nr:polysaccharide deacetylase family protein [Gemmatimonadaceae bacterium]
MARLVLRRMTSRNEDHFILMYHHVGPMDRLGSLSPYVVTPAAFAAQLAVIEARRLEVVTLGELVAATSGERALEPRVVITFDDCPRELLDAAVPELERRNWRATFFAVSGKVGGHNDWDVKRGSPRVPLMDWSDLRELAARGHQIGAHGSSHTSLRRCTHSEARAELTGARETIEQKMGTAVRSLAWPFGDIPDGYAGLCEDAGYDAACAIFSMSRKVLSDPFAIRRILVSERDVGLRMRVKLSRSYLRARPLIVDRRALKSTGAIPGRTT